jgi:hypothetical protein
MPDLGPLLRLTKPRLLLQKLYRPARPVWIACSIVGMTGVAGFVGIAYLRAPEDAAEMLLIAGEHTASALVVAALMGLTYEFFLHKLRAKHDESKLTEAISKVSSVLPQTVFDLIAEMAVRTNALPTLFHPARGPMQEFVFTQNYEILRQLLGLAAARNEEDDVLGWWFASESDFRLKFLGSDLVGLFKRKAFAHRLRAEADRHIANWTNVSERDKGWILNYKWAASRCDEPMYASLEQLLTTTPHDDIRQWILFVPQQMPHRTLSGMVHRYMKDGLHRHEVKNLRLVLDAMPRLHIKQSQKKIVRKHAETFGAAGLSSEYSAVRSVTERRSGDDRRAVFRHGKDRRQPVTFDETPIDLDRYDDLKPE